MCSKFEELKWATPSPPIHTKSPTFSTWLKVFSWDQWTFPAPHDDPCMCRFWEGPQGVCVCVAGGGQQGQEECVTVAWWTMEREQYVGQGLALTDLSRLEPRLGVLNFCMHDQWCWMKKERRKTAAGWGRGEKQVRALLKDRLEQKKWSGFSFYQSLRSVLIFIQPARGADKQWETEIFLSILRKFD